MNGLYQVSNFGRVKSLNYYIVNNGIRKFHSETTLSLCIDKTGYVVVNLNKNGKRKVGKVHRLVAEAFIPNVTNKPQVNHIDGDKTNNNVDNLEWCTNRENQIHAVRTGLTHHTEKQRKSFDKIRIDNSKKVIQMDLEGNEIKLWNSMEEAAKYIGICRSGISECCSGKHKTAGGFKWKYV